MSRTSARSAEASKAALLAKIDTKTANLQDALAAGNTGYVIQKLTDFRTYVDSVNTVAKPKPKIVIDPQDAAALITSADDTITCVSGLWAARPPPRRALHLTTFELAASPGRPVER